MYDFCVLLIKRSTDNYLNLALNYYVAKDL